ncbi:MAG TPA: methionyl-tRNA formyltransferase [Alphaproteobacteria bacterium]|jgi:methionyl-tRNA formyltransferase|nr:methionyl-tRNA formyltransferase [Alphaproteobacteria bacterium]
MRLAFMGTPPFAAKALEALIRAGHEIAAVYSQPPRPAGRGHKLVPSAVHQLAEQHGIPVRTPPRLRTAVEEHEAFAALKLDLAVVAAYGLILPQPILDAPRLGCLNIHGSLLPRWRGAAPVQRAILAGDKETGITIMRMDAGLDTGPMLLKGAVPIGRWTTSVQLFDQLADLGAELIVEAIARLEKGDLPDIPQPEDGVTYAAKLDRADGVIDWNLPAADLDRRVRALNPWPGTSFEFRGERIKLLEATVATGEGQPGTILSLSEDGSPVVACNPGALKLATVQRPNRGPQDAASFLRALELEAGSRL